MSVLRHQLTPHLYSQPIQTSCPPRLLILIQFIRLQSNSQVTLMIYLHRSHWHHAVNQLV